MADARREEAEAILRRTGALLNGHFQLASGRHSPAYVEKFRILERPKETERLCRLIAERFRDQGPTLVAGPTTGGIILSYEVARELGVRGIFAEPVEAEDAGGHRRFGRGFRVEPGEKALVVDDVLTTGSSVRQVLEALREAGGVPIGVGVLVDRSGGSLHFGVPFFACLTLDLPTYEASECPLCAGGEPLTVT